MKIAAEAMFNTLDRPLEKLQHYSVAMVPILED
jgi:hypothetical protein